MIEPGPPTASREIVAPVIHGKDRIATLAQIDLMTAQGHYPIRAVLILQRPSYLRLEMMPVIGTPDFFLAATPDEMKIFIPSRNEFYSGKPSAGNLARFLPWSFAVEEIVMILSSTYPPLAGSPVSYERYPEDGLLRVEMKTPSGPSQTIWMEKNSRPARLIRYDTGGREVYRVRYEDYAEGSVFAEKISIQWADHVTSVSVQYSDLKVEKASDLSVFTLPVPAGSKIIQLD
ncbi:MAG: DUF4292 domain-containing protein [Deltaproteobacteria bacterium]